MSSRGSLAKFHMRRSAFMALLCTALAGCSIEQTAVDVIGDAITGGGSVYTSDEDPQLIREALPFGLKTFEGLLEVSPQHRGLLLASARGFTAYAYLLQWNADRLEDRDLAAARTLRVRARRLFLRGRNYAFRGLEIDRPEFRLEVVARPAEALAVTGKNDVSFLYWGGAAWAGALSAAKDDLELIAELPIAGAMVGRVLELDESFDRGAAHEFFVSYEGSRPGGSADKARQHYWKALEFSNGTRASAHVALAEIVSVRRQNLQEFKQLLASANAVDPDAAPEYRLINSVAQDRARWLEARIPQLFVSIEKEETVK